MPFRLISNFALVLLSIILRAGLASASPIDVVEKRLVLFGGGDLSPPGVQQFVKWARPIDQGQATRILVITWPTDNPNWSVNYYEQLFNAALKAQEYPLAFGTAVIPSPTRQELLSDNKTESEAAQTKFFKALATATAVFFSGGDQRDAIDVIKKFPSIEAELLKKYEKGIVFAGTSAGTALMSNPMIMGDDNDSKKFVTEKGLGLLPPSILVDQHFLKRKRQERLKISLLKNHLPLGIGVDEDGAVTVVNSRTIRVVDNKTLTIMINALDTSLDKIALFSVKEGQLFDIVERRPIENLVVRSLVNLKRGASNQR